MIQQEPYKSHLCNFIFFNCLSFPSEILMSCRGKGGGREMTSEMYKETLQFLSLDDRAREPKLPAFLASSRSSLGGDIADLELANKVGTKIEKTKQKHPTQYNKTQQIPLITTQEYLPLPFISPTTCTKYDIIAYNQ